MRRLVLLTAALLLAGCQTTARYKPKGETDSYGYSSERISARSFTVTFQGDSATELAQARDFALLRAAELTREAGGTHFKVIGERTRLQRDGSRQWTGPVTGGNADLGSREYPAAWLEVEILPATPPADSGQSGVFDAAVTQANLEERYRFSRTDATKRD